MMATNLPQTVVYSWDELAPMVRTDLGSILGNDPAAAAERWRVEFQSNPSSAAGLVITYAAMSAAGIWGSVARLINAWGVGLFFVPQDDLADQLNNHEDFIRLWRIHPVRRWAHHWYWQRSWIQTNIKQATIHIGLHRERENGQAKAEVHLDVYNSFYRRFNLLLAFKHLSNEVLGQKRYEPVVFHTLLTEQGIFIPDYQRGIAPAVDPA